MSDYFTMVELNQFPIACNSWENATNIATNIRKQLQLQILKFVPVKQVSIVNFRLAPLWKYQFCRTRWWKNSNVATLYHYLIYVRNNVSSQGLNLLTILLYARIRIGRKYVKNLVIDGLSAFPRMKIQIHPRMSPLR